MLAFYILLSVLVSFLCSMLEAVILSVTPSYLLSIKANNKSLYDKISYLKKDIEKPLASILTFNTIAHTIGAAGAGAEAQKLWGNEYLAVFSAVLTFIILFFSEIIPKSIGARSWKFLLPYSNLLLKPMIILSYPIVAFSTIISNFIKGKSKDRISRAEIPALAEIGLKDGVISENEYKAMNSLLKFSDVKLGDILKPFSEVAGVRADQDIPEAYQEIQKNTYSRLIVFGVDNNDIKGYVMRKNILQSYIEKKSVKIFDIKQNILILPENTSGNVLFKRLLSMKVHIAAVINEAGDFLGIVTLEDLIESILGQSIYDEFDE